MASACTYHCLPLQQPHVDSNAAILFRSLEMADELWRGLAVYASECGIELHLDIFGRRSLALAEQIGASAVKLHPTDLANVRLLEAVAASAARRVLLGVGGSHAGEIDQALSILAGSQTTQMSGCTTVVIWASPLANAVLRLPVLLSRRTS